MSSSLKIDKVFVKKLWPILLKNFGKFLVNAQQKGTSTTEPKIQFTCYLQYLIKSMNYAEIIFMLSLLIMLGSCQQAILFSSSLGYYNLRQNNNIVKIYQHLKNLGFKDDNILLMFGQMQTCCEKNAKFGSLSFYDGDYANIFKDIEVDYYQSQLTEYTSSEIFRLQYPKFTLNKKKLTRNNKNQPLLYYVTGHGGDFYFKIRERSALLDEQFMILFDHLTQKNITDKIAMISDSCSAITPFETIRANNIISFASSSFDEKSMSHGSDSLMYTPKSDDFTFYFDEMLQKTSHWTFEQAKKYQSFQRLQVHSKIVTNSISTRTSLDDFMRHKKQKILKHKFLNNKKFIDIFT